MTEKALPCGAELHIGDDHGDNHATMRCQLDAGHDGQHVEEYDAQMGGHVVVRWELDHRRECKFCHKLTGEPVGASWDDSDGSEPTEWACVECAERHLWNKKTDG